MVPSGFQLSLTSQAGRHPARKTRRAERGKVRLANVRALPGAHRYSLQIGQCAPMTVNLPQSTQGLHELVSWRHPREGRFATTWFCLENWLRR